MGFLARKGVCLLFLLLTGFLPIKSFAVSFDVHQTEFGPNQFLVLCYHAIPVRGQKNVPYTVSQNEFVEEIDYLRSHGFHFISLKQIFSARYGGKKLPDRAILLTFDDGYISYGNFVVPFLSRQKIPSAVAIIGKFVEHPPAKLSEPLMSWEKIRELSKNPYVEVFSHTYDLHRSIQYNAIGNVASAVSVFRYDKKLKRYETKAEYRQRLIADFAAQEKIFVKKLGFKPRAIVWPYGRYNATALDVAKKFGIEATFTLEWGFNDVHHLHAINRTMVETFSADSGESPIGDFIVDVKQPEAQTKIIRAVQVDLDLIYDPKSFKQTDKNLGKLINRLVKMGINRVYLQAFADPDGDGNVEGVYFYNHQLPVVSDLFSHAAHQISIHGIEIYAWMPTLAVTFPEPKFNKVNRVMEKKDGVIRESSSWYHRLSPFSSAALKRMQSLYEDLAAHAQIDGVLFQDDAYLNDFEDFNPLAIQAYKHRFGENFQVLNDNQDHQAALKLARFKGDAINLFIEGLKKSVLKYRPEAHFARNIYASVITNPDSEAWFAENYNEYLKHYDEVVVMAYPEMEKQSDPEAWLKKLVSIVDKIPGAAKKTTFKLQSFGWSRNMWIKSEDLLNQMRTILASGGVHIAYYPDNVFMDEPKEKTVRLEMSLDNIPRRLPARE